MVKQSSDQRVGCCTDFGHAETTKRSPKQEMRKQIVKGGKKEQKRSETGGVWGGGRRIHSKIQKHLFNCERVAGVKVQRMHGRSKRRRSCIDCNNTGHKQSQD